MGQRMTSTGTPRGDPAKSSILEQGTSVILIKFLVDCRSVFDTISDTLLTGRKYVVQFFVRFFCPIFFFGFCCNLRCPGQKKIGRKNWTNTFDQSKWKSGRKIGRQIGREIGREIGRKIGRKIGRQIGSEIGLADW